MRHTVQLTFPWQSQGIYLLGDPHIDAPDHARRQMLGDLDRATENGDRIITMGDLWSFILPRDLKRYTGKHAEQADAIINQRIDEAEGVFAPYADYIDLMLIGNHEVSVIKYHHIDPLSLLIDRLNRHRDTEKNGLIAHGGYQCWVKLRFQRGKRQSVSQVLWLDHGKGGGAPVSRGMIDGNRIMVDNIADVYAIAHKHVRIQNTQPVKYMDRQGNIRKSDRDFLIVAGYSSEETQDTHHERGYMLDYSEEGFYNHETTGSARIVFTPTARDHKRSKTISVERQIEQKSYS